MRKLDFLTARSFLISPISWLLVLIFLTAVPVEHLIAASLATLWGLVGHATRRYLTSERSSPNFLGQRLKTVLVNFLVTATIVVASFQVTAIGPHLRDPIGWNSNGFVLSNYREVYSSQKGDEIIIRRAESSFLMMRLLQKVFVFIHKPSEPENTTNLVFSYVPGQLDETEPRVIWKTATYVGIQLALSKSINVDVQKPRLGAIQINYDIHYACHGNNETRALSDRGDLALVRTTSCSRKDGSIYYVRAVLIEKAHVRSGLRVLAFQYEPTDRGLEFDSPVLRWDNRDTLKIALPKRSILRTILQESSVKGIRITYDFR